MHDSFFFFFFRMLGRHRKHALTLPIQRQPNRFLNKLISKYTPLNSIQVSLNMTIICDDNIDKLKYDKQKDGDIYSERYYTEQKNNKQTR